ncbi:TetR/AcrR family transcriptional regulator C-terminal domain-containing protein, partial [Conexibacter sp. JD483]|uniref:TetR/AcrR family transcriptional regulator C-terminal domain-containing protein n=1 Tax=unclassified Conexibacter TaxID=2627773 RepID=UPI0027183E14
TFMLGHVIVELAGHDFASPEAPEDTEHRQAITEYVRAQIDAGGLPHLAQDNVSGMLQPGDPDIAFERGLDWLLAGAAAALEPQ